MCLHTNRVINNHYHCFHKLICSTNCFQIFLSLACLRKYSKSSKELRMRSETVQHFFTNGNKDFLMANPKP